MKPNKSESLGFVNSWRSSALFILGFRIETENVMGEVQGGLNSGCVPLVESKKGFDLTDFLDLRFSMERQIQKRIYNHQNTGCHAIMNECQETRNNVIC